jgi:RNA polymerase sigma factor (sigma-70 family)
VLNRDALTEIDRALDDGLPSRESTAPVAPDIAAWLAELRKGDASAYRRLHGFLCRTVLPHMGLPSWLSREEVATDAASTVWMAMPTLADDAKFLAFVATITRRVIARRRREQRRHDDVLGAWQERCRSQPSRPRAETDDALARLIKSVPRKDRALFTMLYVDGLSRDEIQATLGISSEVLRQRKHRLNQALRDAAHRLGLLPRTDAPPPKRPGFFSKIVGTFRSIAGT